MIAGVQVSSFKPILKTDAQVYAAFEEMKAMGVSTVQLQWIDPSVPIPVIRDAMDKTGISSVSVQDFYETIRLNKDYYIRLNAETGGTWMCVSRIPDRLKSPDGLDAYASELRAFESELAQYGQKLCLHPVSADFAPIGGVNPVEYLLDRLPALPLCLDLYHINKCGFSMPAWINRYAGRVSMVHFKDALSGRLVPAGQGDTDWTGVAEACLRADIPYAFVEQERWAKDPFDCLREALDWLKGEISAAEA